MGRYETSYKEQESQQFTPPPSQKEREMHNIQKLLEEQEFDSEEKVNAFLNNLLQSGNIPSAPMEPRDIAYNLIFEAQEKQGAMQKPLIQEALDIYPNTPDAYVLLAQLENSDEKRSDLLLKAIVVGVVDLGDAYFEENKGHF